MSPRLIFLIAATPFLMGATGAFSPSLGIHNPNSRPTCVGLDASPADRRAFIAGAAISTFGTVFTTVVAPARGEEVVDDLAMPTPEEAKANEEAEMAARLRRKAELQKKMSRPMSYGASLKSEKEKQDGLKKSKEERRNALCEELGRGC